MSTNTNDVALETLTEKIQYQARFIVELQAELRRVRQASVEVMLGQLRLREAVLLYVGQHAGSFVQELGESFGGEIAQAVSRSVFVLDNAPVPAEARESVRTACNRGVNRW